MSEPIRTTPAKRVKLAAALKRNMARRKVVSRQSSVVSKERPKQTSEPRVAGGEPLAAGVSEAKGGQAPLQGKNP